MFPECKGAASAEQQTQKKYSCADSCLPAKSLFADEETKGDYQQNGGKNQKGYRSPDSGDRHKSREKSTEDTAQGIACAEPARNGSALIEAVDGCFDKGRSNRTEQKQGKHKKKQAGRKSGCNQIAGIYGKDQKCGNTENNIFPHGRNRGDPKCGHEDSLVKAGRIGVFISGFSSVKVSGCHSDHDRADDNGPYDLRRGKIRREEPAGSQLHCHD